MGAPDVEEVLARILSTVRRIIPYEAANISLIGDGIARVICSTGYDRFSTLAQPYDAELPIAETANLREMIATGQPLIISDVAEYAGWIHVPNSTWIRSHAGAPVRSEGQVIGFLNLDSSIPGLFDEADAEPLQIFADQAGFAIENARLHALAQRQSAELEKEIEARTEELAQREEELRAANERLQELDRLKSQFISGVSHDLRTPITNIKLLLEMLERNRPGRQQECLDTIKRELSLLEDAITDLLDLSRLDLGQAQPQLTLTDVGGLVKTLAADRTALAAARKLTLTVEVDPSAPRVLTDERMILRAVGNLLSNAINYTPPGGLITLLVQGRQREGREWLAIVVRDTGPGIAREEIPRLFQRFYRGAAALQAGTTGTGLGLAICREIVTLLCGVLTVDSRLGSGSSFTIWLPADTD